MSEANSQTTITPHTQGPLVTRHYPSESALDEVIQKSAIAQKAWSKVPLKERIAIGYKFIVCISFLSFSLMGAKIDMKEEFRSKANEIPLELTLQMGR